MDSRIRTPKVERVLLYQRNKIREYVAGTLCLTDRHLIFIEPTGLKETWVLYHHIQSVDRQPLTTKGYPLIIDTKTFQQLCLIIPRETDCHDVIETINLFSKPDKYEDLYGFNYKPNTEGFPQTRGWNLYDPLIEYDRMEVPSDLWKHTNLNQSYEMCETYSSVLYVPAEADPSVILGSAKFRSKGRLPVLSYFCSNKKSALCRCSQPLSYITRRSPEDEAMIQCIINANPNSSFLYLLDTRPKINAMANKAAHKGGYENTDNYPNVIYQFYNIHNIHVMRESLQKLMDGIHSPTGVSSVLSCLDSSGWLKHIHLIMDTATFIAKALYHEGVSVLVHCSDGWDRTAQTCALASLLIDPYYRTIHGFMILIEKEWLSFGHKFTTRCGHLNGDSKEVSPIFTQFLDAVWQVLVQFPVHFQFNELFLITIHDHLYSCQFGTFFGNNEKERKDNKLAVAVRWNLLVFRFSSKTYSLWGYIWTHLDDFVNSLYDKDIDNQLIVPVFDIPFLRFWKGLYCRYDTGPHAQELWEEVACSYFQQNICLEDHIRYLTQHMNDLKEKLHHYKSHCTQKCNNEDTDQISDETKQIAESNERYDSVKQLVDQLQSLVSYVPEMNLPWRPLREETRCGCGSVFTFTIRKYHCSYCGSVVCGNCGEYHAQLPRLAMSTSHRMCKSCSKLTIIDDKSTMI